MKKDYRALYEALIDGVKSEAPVLKTTGGECWAMAEAEEGIGLGMMTKLSAWMVAPAVALAIESAIGKNLQKIPANPEYLMEVLKHEN